MTSAVTPVDTSPFRLPPGLRRLTPRRPTGTTWAAWWAGWTPVLLWLVAACITYSKFLAHPTRSVPGGADGILYAWYFESVQHSLWHLQNPLFSSALNAPTGVNIMWNTALIIVAILASPLTAALGAVATVGLMMLLAPVLSATASYIVLRRLTGRAVASAIASTMYGFGPFFVGQAGHLHLIFAAPLVPVVFYLGHRLFVDQQTSPRRVGCQLGVSVAVGMLISEEVVAIVAIISTVATVALALLNPEQLGPRIRFAARGLLWAVLVAGVLLVVPLGYQFYGPLALNGGIAGYQSLDIAGLIKPSLLQRFGSAQDALLNQTFPANEVENTGYLGWPLIITLVGAAVLLARQRPRFLIWWLVTFASSVSLSFGANIFVNGHLTSSYGPWNVLRRLPIIESLVAVRFTMTTTFLVSVLLAFALAGLRPRWAQISGSVVVVAALLTLFPAARADEMLDIPRSQFFASDAVKAIPQGASTFVLPQRSDPNTAAEVMYWQIDSELRFDMVGGYSVFSDDGAPRYQPVLPYYAQALQNVADTGRTPSDSEITLSRVTIASSGVRYLVISSQVLFREATIQAAARMAQCTPRVVDDVVLCEVSLS